MQAPLRRRADAARHRRRRPLRRRLADRVGRRLQRRRADAGRSARGPGAAPRAQGEGDDRPDAGRQPARLRPGRDRRATATSSGSSRSRARTRSPATRSTPASTSSSPRRSTAFPKDTAWSIERSFFPSLIERGETFVAYVYDGYWIDIGTPAKYLQVHRDIMDGRYPRRRSTAPSARPGSRPEARIEDGVELHGPCFIDEGVVVKAGAKVLPYSVIGRQTHVDEAAVIDGSIIWPNGWIGREAVVRGSILGRNCHIGRNAVARNAGRPRRQDRHHRLQQAMSINPNIFKAYDVRGLYPSEVNEEAARLIGRGFVSYLDAKRDRRRRDMRLSSPSVAARLHRGRPRAGRRRRRLRHDGDRHDVLRRRPRRPRRRRPDHRVAQPEGIQRHQDGAARGVPAERRRRHRRDPRHGHDERAARAARRRRAR